MKLSTLAVLLGTVFSVPQLVGLFSPAVFAEKARKFPRSEAWGYLLMSIATAWFLWNLDHESISDFAAYKKVMLTGFAAIGVATCIFVRDFLAVRGLAIVLLLLAWYTLNLTRWAESPWRLLIVCWAYVWVISGMWFTISPWRLRDYLHWTTATPERIRFTSGLRLAWGVLVALLGVTVLR